MGPENNDILTAAFIEETAVIRVNGKGSFKICPTMKQFIHQTIDNKATNQTLIDMQNCTGMDSTFMGVIAGLSCFIKEKTNHTFKLVNLSNKNKKLLTTLGVDQVVEYSTSTSPEEKKFIHLLPTEIQSLKPDLSNKLDAAQTTLEAHATLVTINPENLDRFKSVIELLQNDVQNLSNN